MDVSLAGKVACNDVRREAVEVTAAGHFLNSKYAAISTIERGIKGCIWSVISSAIELAPYGIRVSYITPAAPAPDNPEFISQRQAAQAARAATGGGLGRFDHLVSGMFEKCPNVRIALSHGAGGFALMLTRAQFFWVRAKKSRPRTGTDHPFMKREEPVGKTLRDLGLPQTDVDDVTWNNCFRWLGIPTPHPHGAHAA